MSNCIINSIVSGLPGQVNTNPKVFRVYPDKLKAKPNEILAKSLPDGCKPEEFWEDSIDNKKILAYIFEIEQGGRNSVASIGFTVDKHTIISDLKEIVKELMMRMRESGVLNFEILERYLDKITEGFQKESKIKIGSMIFDVGFFIKSRKMKLQKTNLRKSTGGLI